MFSGGAEKSQQFHNYFLQYSKFLSERPQVRTWECQTCFLPRAQSKLVTPLDTPGPAASWTSEVARLSSAEDKLRPF